MRETGEERPAIRLILVDDQRIVVEGIKFVLESRAADIRVVATGLDGAEAVRLYEEHRPDVVLMDVRMPGMDGVEATRIIHGNHPEAKIVMFTTFGDDEYVQAALQVGAVGYLLKSRPPIEIISSLRAVCDGTLQIDPSVAGSLVRHVSVEESEMDRFAERLEDLTRREREALHLLVQAFDNKQIAEHLGVTEQTARNYVSSIYAKLGENNRIRIARILEKLGY